MIIIYLFLQATSSIKPDFRAMFNLSLDYYHIRLKTLLLFFCAVNKVSIKYRTCALFLYLLVYFLGPCLLILFYIIDQHKDSGKTTTLKETMSHSSLSMNPPSDRREGSSNPLRPSSARARQPPCHAFSVSWKLKMRKKQK